MVSATVWIPDIDCKGSELPTIDPMSLSLLGYLRLSKHFLHSHIQYTVNYEKMDADTNNRTPYVVIEGETLYSIEEVRKTKFILEKVRGIPPHCCVPLIARLIGDIENACYYGLTFLYPNITWRPQPSVPVLELLEKHMFNACEALSEILGDNSHLLDKWYSKGYMFPSYLDAKLFGAAIVIQKCFKNNGYGYGNRRMNTQTGTAQREDVISRTVYVYDIDHQVTEEQLTALFRSCGQVFDYRIYGDANSELRFAFIQFEEKEGASSALSLAGTTLGFYPVGVLPSRTVIGQDNRTVLPRVTQADVKLFFESFCGQGSQYCSNIYGILRRHLNLEAYLDRLHAQLILPLWHKSVIYSDDWKQDPEFLDNLIDSRIGGGTAYVYSCRSDKQHLLRLDQGEYALKVKIKAIEEELYYLELLLHKSFIDLCGYGIWCEGIRMTPTKAFLVFPLMKKGSLFSNIEELDWRTAFKVVRQIAYSLHILHSSQLVFCDLKPQNVLLDDNDNAIMCDLESIRHQFADVVQQTSSYNDKTKVAVPSFDMYSYGVMLLQILTEECLPNSSGPRISIQRRFAGYRIRETLWNTGCKGRIANDMITLALDCKKTSRPSAIETMRRLDAIGKPEP
ncbi:uncharacterized protein [Solanum tuberosum]|uniref:uncharacterized protein isoform X2 n=1 Tax=Solanum tuberosum TaxID=4113 RepID=UPI00073A2007|nr:PREDICTED: uncharacterized protein LOC102601930 isoform X2 [Solanum tuberosum]